MKFAFSLIFLLVALGSGRADDAKLIFPETPRLATTQKELEAIKASIDCLGILAELKAIEGSLERLGVASSG